MEVIISKEKKKNKNLVFITSTLSGKKIYIDTNKIVTINNNLYYYLIFGQTKYNENEKFDFNGNIELKYSGIEMESNKTYINVNEIYLDEKDLYIKDKLYLILIVESNMKNRNNIFNILEKKIMNDNYLLDIYDNKMKINNFSTNNIICVNNIHYDLWED